MPIKVDIKGKGRTLFLEGPIRRQAPHKIELLRDVAKYHTNVSEIVFLHIYFHELSESFLEALEATLKSRIWDHVDFKFCTGQWTRRFQKALAQHAKSIRLFGSTEDSNLFRILCAATASSDPNLSMEHLHLHTPFQEFSILPLQQSLTDKTCRLRGLTLKECCFLGETTLTSLATGLSQNESLETLCFMNCRFEDSSRARLLWESLAGHSNLRSFSLIHEDDSLPTIDGLHQLIKSCKKLSEFKITHPPVRRDRVQFRAGGVRQSSDERMYRGGWWLPSLELRNGGHQQQLEVLDLSKNWMHDDSMEYLAKAAPYLSRLKGLYLGTNHIDNAGIQSLASVILARHWPNLKVLDVFNNLFGITGANSLLEAVQSHTNLERIELCRRDSDCSAEIIHLTNLNYAGRRLWTSQAGVPLGLWPLVLERVYNDTNRSWNDQDKASVIFSMLRQGRILFS